MELAKSLEEVSELWNKERLKLVEPLSEAEIIKKFEKLGKPMSQDVIKVYSTLGGMEEFESDSLLFSFWGIDQILKENEPNSEFISFADFSIYAHFYYFKYETEFVSSVYVDGENNVERIADSFEEFLENYLINPGKYYLFDREEDKKEKNTIIQL